MDKRGGEVQKATDDKDAMNVLLRSHGWTLMAEFINGQIAVRRDQNELMPLENILYLGKREYALGEISFARSVLALPQTIIDTAETEIEMYAEPEEDEDDAT